MNEQQRSLPGDRHSGREQYAGPPPGSVAGSHLPGNRYSGQGALGERLSWGPSPAHVPADRRPQNMSRISQGSSIPDRNSQVVLDPRGVAVDLDASRISTGSRASSSVTLGGESYPVGTMVGSSGLFVIGDPRSHKGSESARTSQSQLSHSTVGSNRKLADRSYAYDFEEWNWPMIRLSCLILVFAAMAALLAAVIGLTIQAKTGCYFTWEWWQGSVVYHIDIPWFHDSDQDSLGDLRGIEERIPYLKHLGVGAVCLRHFLKSENPSWDNPLSFTEIDSRVGTLDQFDNLVQALHRENIQVMLEWTAIFTAEDHPWFVDSRLQSSSTGSKYRNVYAWEDQAGIPDFWKYDNVRNQFYYHRNNSKLPVLDWSNYRVHREVEDTMEFWMKRGVDGFYVTQLEEYYGMTPTLAVAILSGMRNTLGRFRSTGVRALMIHESFLKYVGKDAPRKVEVLLEQLHLVVVPINVNPSNLTASLQTQINQGVAWHSGSRTPWPSWELNRTSTIDLDYLSALQLMLVTLPGSPSLVAGQEVARDLAFEVKDDGRNVPLQWSPDEDTSVIFPSYREPAVSATNIKCLAAVIQIRQTAPALRSDSYDWPEDAKDVNQGPIRFLNVDSKVFFFERSFPRQDSFYFAANFGIMKYTGSWDRIVSVNGYAAANTTVGPVDDKLWLNDVQLSKGAGVVFRVIK